jgi:hypothetical protein
MKELTQEEQGVIRDALHAAMVDATAKIGFHWVVDIASSIAYEVAEEISATRQGGHRHSVNDRPWRSISVALGNDAQYFKHVLEKAAAENEGAKFRHPLIKE